MAVDEVRIRLRRKLEEMLGMDEADLLMDRPPGGWADLVTKDHLDMRLDAFERVVDARFAAVDTRFESLRNEWKADLHREMTVQTWRLVGAMTALGAVLVGALRF